MTGIDPTVTECLDSSEEARFTQQLKLEVGPGHQLFPLLSSLKAIARVRGSDDVIFSIDDKKGRFALVHLTWQPSQKAPWPETAFFENASSLNNGIREELGL